ncbi:hypothetical protein [Azospirillum argentinense]
MVELIRIGTAPEVSVISQKYVLEMNEAEELLSEMEKIVGSLKKYSDLME